MLEDIKKLLEDNEVTVNKKQGATPEEVVVIKSGAIKPKNNMVVTHMFDVQIYSRKDVDEFTFKVYDILIRKVLSINGVGYPILEVAEDGVTEYKNSNLKKVEYRYSVDVIKRR